MGKKSTKRSECSAVATNLLFEGGCVGVWMCVCEAGGEGGGGGWFVILSYVLVMLVCTGSLCCLLDLFIFLFESHQNKSH